MGFLLGLDTPPMEARSVGELPRDFGWQFEPKWDGFRCLAFKAGGEVELRAKSGKPLGRYFPEMLAALRDASAEDCVLDGELVIARDGAFSFAALQDRLHPAESRIRKLAGETPAHLVLFDCLARAAEGTLLDRGLNERRSALAAVADALPPGWFTGTPFTVDRAAAQGWLDGINETTDGVIAKRADAPYEPGARAMLKIKHLRSADCVVGGFRYVSKTKLVGSLLLGLYDEAGRLNHVGFTSAISDRERPSLTKRLEQIVEPPGFTGDTPGGPSRWSNERSSEWLPLRPELVVEVRYDHVTGTRFRHGTTLLRWRPDKAPSQCCLNQLRQRAAPGH